jgi:hypothetical protein
MESLELFGTRILPEFAERDAAAQQRKSERLAPIVEAALARKPGSDHPPLPAGDYTFPAIPRGMADRAGSDEFQQWLDAFAEQSATGEAPEAIEGLIG